jgi:NADPH-dependent 2,4-dienoyl-CoA reductase/sulfur reductase-like enzyme
VLKSGERLECSLVLVGVGARPNTDLFAGQLDLVEGPPGGIKVNSNLQVCCTQLCGFQLHACLRLCVCVRNV